MKEIELTNKNISNINYDNIIAVTIAEGGAMGEPNGFYAMNKTKELYHSNFSTGEISFGLLCDKFPLLKNFSCFFEKVNKLDLGWNWFNMGFGNYLIVREYIFNDVKKYIDDNLSPEYEHGELYNKWPDILINVINNVNSEEEYNPEREYAFRNYIIEQIGEINITKNNLSTINEKNVLFIEVANDGITYIMNNKKQLFYVELEYGKEITKEDFEKHFPKYAETGVDNEKYYKAINLGMGHALLIKSDIYEEYMKILKENIVYENEYEDCYTAYCHWMDCAIKFLEK